MPEETSPTLIETDAKSCYFKKQPETENEIQAALHAMEVSCCSGLMYKGNNKAIISQILNNSNIDNSCILSNNEKQ